MDRPLSEEATGRSLGLARPAGLGRGDKSRARSPLTRSGICRRLEWMSAQSRSWRPGLPPSMVMTKRNEVPGTPDRHGPDRLRRTRPTDRAAFKAGRWTGPPFNAAGKTRSHNFRLATGRCSPGTRPRRNAAEMGRLAERTRPPI